MASVYYMYKCTCVCTYTYATHSELQKPAFSIFKTVARIPSTFGAQTGHIHVQYTCMQYMKQIDLDWEGPPTIIVLCSIYMHAVAIFCMAIVGV